MFKDVDIIPYQSIIEGEKSEAKPQLGGFLTRRALESLTIIPLVSDYQYRFPIALGNIDIESLRVVTLSLGAV